MGNQDIQNWIKLNEGLAQSKRCEIALMLNDLSGDISEAKQVISRGGFGAYPTEFSTSVSRIWAKIQELKNLENSINEIKEIAHDSHNRNTD